MRPLLFSILLGTAFSVTALAQPIAPVPAGVPAALASAKSAGSSSALQVTRPIYAWRTESEADKKTGKFNHCLVKNMYDNGTVLMVAENFEGIKRLALNFPQDKMTAGEHYDLTLQVDKRDVFPVEAVAISPQILTIGIPDALPDQMRKGQAVYLRGPNDEVVYTLDGVDGAITALQDCMVTQQTGKPSTLQTANTDVNEDTATPAPTPAPIIKTAENPVVKPAEENKPIVAAQAAAPVTQAPSQPVKAAPSTAATTVASVTAPITNAVQNLTKKLNQDKKIEVVQESAVAPSGPTLPGNLNAVFEKAAMAPTAFISTPEKDKTSKRPLDYAWMKGNLFIGTKQQNAVPDAGLVKASTYYLSLLKDRCTGPFVAEAGNVAKTPSLSWLVVEAACSPGKKDDTIAALLFANDAKNLTVYFFEAPAKEGSKAIKARDTLLKTLQSN